jgi:hypothetical protein
LRQKACAPFALYVIKEVQLSRIYNFEKPSDLKAAHTVHAWREQL